MTRNHAWRTFAACLGIAGACGAHAAPPPIEAYGRLPAIEQLELSPSGNRFAFVATTGNERRLFVREVDGDKTLLALAGVGDAKLRDLDWAGEGFVVARISDRYNLGAEYGGAYELSRMLSLDVKSKQIKMLFTDPRFLGTVNGVYGYAEQDGRWVGFFSAPLLTGSGASRDRLLLDGDPDLVSMDLQTGKFHRIAESSSGHGAGWLVDPNGTVLATARYDDERANWRLYAGRSNRVIAEQRDEIGMNYIVGMGRTPGTILYMLHDDDGAARYMERPLGDGGEAKEVFVDRTVQDFVFDPDTGLLAGFVEEGDEPKLTMFDKARESLLQATRRAFPKLQVGFVSWSRDFSRLVVKTEGPGDSGTWWLVDARTQSHNASADFLGEQYPDVKPDQVGAFDTIDYTAADGLKMQGILTLPPGREAKGLPLVVLPHGGPEARDYPVFDFWAQAYASRGYAVWQPNFRGSSGYGLAFLRAGYGEYGRKMQTDISDGVAELARRGIVDAHRACIVGGSYGGYAALAGVTLQQGLYRCAVSVAGISDLRDFLADRRGRLGVSGMRYLRQYLGDGDVADISPARLAARADAPVLLIHGKDDTRVPIRQSELMKRALEKAHKPVEMVTLEGEDHFLSREATRIAMLRASIAFVERHNPATPDAAPAAPAANAEQP